MRSFVFHFFELKLRVLFDSTIDFIDKSFGVTKILLKKLYT